MKKLAPLIQLFFSDRLNRQLQASPNTIAAYRDTFKILLIYLKEQTRKRPSNLNLDDIDAQCVGKFLNYLEIRRHNSVRTRNARLAAIHSFFNYVGYKEPQYSGQIQRVLCIPSKKFDKRDMTYLNNEEGKAILSMPDQTKWIGLRDYALLVFALQSGLRVSEIINLKIEQIKFGRAAHIRCLGKGRKERCTPLTQETEKVLKNWLKIRNGHSPDVVFPSQRGSRLSRDAVEKLVKKHSVAAQQHCPSLKEKNITPHTLRHSTAVSLLQAGVDTSVIALYLGHESLETTQIYLKADLTIKEKAIAAVLPMNTSFKRYKPSDQLLAFLEGL